MSSQPRLLSAAPDSGEATRLRREIIGLEEELKNAKAEALQAKQASADAIAAVRELRKQLNPLFTALKMVYGEINRVDVTIENSDHSAPGHAGTLSPKLEMMKRQLGGRQAEFIDLLSHGAMSAAQLVAAAKCAKPTAYDVIYRLTKAGLIDKDGGKYSLRES